MGFRIEALRWLNIETLSGDAAFPANIDAYIHPVRQSRDDVRDWNPSLKALQSSTTPRSCEKQQASRPCVIDLLVGLDSLVNQLTHGTAQLQILKDAKTGAHQS
ncbi:hypothetical protein CesoFtcFv8_009787 [Champsocephalus esox]|uniref:Uncharacterized protein n=2 Tax=Champsocephalus TaxID=52236 RepID=A0AAN8HQJ7_CHAGU|nr:hypothetical protein CesoFtcFv8_009787 [Champsocephalus esox]KAK5924681.1 hypothetical protein CgunFtcFv8_017273 [Champsocephalus gunnari]